MKQPAKIRPSQIVSRVLGVLLLVCVAAAATPAGKRKVSRIKALRLDPGTAIEIRLLSQIHSGEAQEGHTFEATLAKPLVVDGRTVVPKNTGAKGRVVEAVSSGRLKRPAALTLELVDAGGYSLRTEPVTLDGESHAGRNAALIGGGAAAGAIIGALTGGKKGAVIGAAIGAGAGTGTAYLTGERKGIICESGENAESTALRRHHLTHANQAHQSLDRILESPLEPQVLAELLRGRLIGRVGNVYRA